MTTGRPSKIHEKGPEVLKAVRQGLYDRTAAGNAGIAERTLKYWLQRGREEAERLTKPRTRPRKREAPYLAFYRQYVEARAEGELKLARIVWQEAEGGTKITETRTLEVTDPNGDLIKKEIAEVTKIKGADWRAAAFVLERRYGWGSRDQTVNLDIDFSQLTDQELEMIEAGEDPVNVIMARFAK